MNAQDSSEGLARMYVDLEPLARRVRSSACWLLFFSFMFCGSIEGFFGIIAACGVLCCSAPGSLGTAYASRCTKTCAIITATIAMFHLCALSTFGFVILPEVPHAVAEMCTAKERELNSMSHGAAPAGKLPTSSDSFDLHDIFLSGRIFADAAKADPAKTPLAGDMVAKPLVHVDAVEATQVKPLLGADSATWAPAAEPDAEANVDEKKHHPLVPTSFTAELIAGYASKGARKLEEVAAIVQGKPLQPLPLSEHCTKVASFFAHVAPMVLLAAATVEFGLFLSALTLAKRCAQLVSAARRFGANAM